MNNQPVQFGQTSTDKNLIGRRDAFHVPACLVTSANYLHAGMRVRFDRANYNQVCPLAGGEEHQAIVDPFLPSGILLDPGTLVWVLVIPSKVDGMSHAFKIVGEPEKKPEKEIVYVECDDEEYDSGDGCNWAIC